MSLHSFHSVKSQTRAFNTFQDNFLAKANEIVSPSPTILKISSNIFYDNKNENTEENLKNANYFSENDRPLTEARIIPNLEKSEFLTSVFENNKNSLSPGNRTESFTESINKNPNGKKNRRFFRCLPIQRN